MKASRIWALLSIVIFFSLTVYADVMIIGLKQTEGKTQHTIDAHVVSYDYLVTQMEKLSHLTSAFTPVISIQKDVPSSELFNFLADLRRLGFHKFNIMAEGSVTNTAGTHIFTINTESNALEFCLGIVETNNFVSHDIEKDAILQKQESQPVLRFQYRAIKKGQDIYLQPSFGKSEPFGPFVLNEHKTSYVYIPPDRPQAFSSAQQIYFEETNGVWLFTDNTLHMSAKLVDPHGVLEK